MLGRETAIVHRSLNVRSPVVVSPDRTEQNVPLVAVYFVDAAPRNSDQLTLPPA